MVGNRVNVRVRVKVRARVGIRVESGLIPVHLLGEVGHSHLELWWV